MGSLVEVLAMRRRRCFVGGVAEAELFRAALAASEPSFAVLYLHGPGGLGKTSLLDAFAALAEEGGARVVYQVPSPTINAAAIVTLQRYLEMPSLAWDYLTLFEPEPFDDYFALADMPRAEGADFVVGGRRYGMFARDFRQLPVDALVALWCERALGQGFVSRKPAQAPAMLVLSQSDFTEAVRQALRDLHEPELLAKNPLQRARLLRDAERTYLKPAASQEATAELLGLPAPTGATRPRGSSASSPGCGRGKSTDPSQGEQGRP